MKFIKKIDGKSHYNIYDNTFTAIRMTTINVLWNKVFTNGTQPVHEAAFELASNGAQSGCNDSKALLAVCLYYGCGCTKNVDEALILAKESADQGNKYGHLIYGRILYWKDGESRATAIQHYMISAKMGLNEGLLTMGSMYMNGIYLPMDKKNGLVLIMKAADQKHGPAYEQLGRCYEFGDGVPVDKSEARKWYQMAVDAGFTFAQKGLDRL
jgi:TPR repeat protein